MKKSEESLRELWDTIKEANICIIGVPEGKEKGQRAHLKKIIAENFSNLRKEMKTLT